MGVNLSICLSLSTTLRCSGLSRFQSIAVLVPPSLELATSLALIWAQYGRGRKHWYLVVESWIFFALAFVDFMAHEDDRITTVLSAFQITDKIIGALSFLPLLFYSVFLLLFANSNLLPSIPHRPRFTVKYTLIAFIPPILVLNELGSLLGIDYTQTSPGVLAVTFDTILAKSLWQFFSMTTLGLLTLYQAIVFFLASFQIVRYYVAHRNRPDDSSEITTDRSPARGLGFIAAGVKIGAIESVLGFAGLEFEGTFTRRLLRLIGRVLLCIGSVRCADGAEGFSLFRSPSMEELAPPRPLGNIRGMIGNPRTSTFAQLSPRATAFYNLKTNAALSGGPGPSAMGMSAPLINNRSRSRSVSEATQAAVTRANRRATQRVTVHYDGSDAPMLEMRFSDLGMPEAALVVGDGRMASAVLGLKTYADAYAKVNASNSGNVTAFPVTLPALPKPISDAKYPRRSTLSGNASGGMSGERSSTLSALSVASDSLEVVREMASKFPGLPPRVTPKSRARSLAALNVSTTNLSKLDENGSKTTHNTPVATSAVSLASSEEGGGGATGLHPRLSRRKAPPPLPSPRLFEQMLAADQATHTAFRKQQQQQSPQQETQPQTPEIQKHIRDDSQNTATNPLSPFNDPTQEWVYNLPPSDSSHSPKSDYSFIDADFHMGTGDATVTRVATVDTTLTSPFFTPAPYHASYSPSRHSFEITMQDRPRIAQRAVGIERKRTLKREGEGEGEGEDDLEKEKEEARRKLNELEMDGIDAEILADRELASREKTFPWSRHSTADSGIDVGEVLDAAWQTAGLTRIKTLSSARSTPTPISPGAHRHASVHLLHDTIVVNGNDGSVSDSEDERTVRLRGKKDSGAKLLYEIGRAVGVGKQSVYPYEQGGAVVPDSPAPFVNIHGTGVLRVEDDRTFVRKNRVHMRVASRDSEVY